MEVDRQPSPWPVVAMLAGLLLFCLMAPRFWQTTSELEVVTIGPPSDFDRFDSIASGGGRYGATPTGPSMAGGYTSSFSDGSFSVFGVPNSRLPVFFGPPTIEELLAARASAAPTSSDTELPNINSPPWPVLPPGPSGPVSDPNTQPPVFDADGEVVKAITTVIERAGQLLAEYSITNRVPALCDWVADETPDWLSYISTNSAPRANAPGQPFLQIDGPNSRLAMRTEPRKMQRLHAWCVPQSLFEQLDRLAEQADSAQWASRVRNELHSLTEREHLEGDDIQPILADLSDAAHEAAQMADQTENDRLRVELLRVHWALARRLDCWGAMHEQRVAAHFQGRVAARGTLGQYFEQPNQPEKTTDVAALSNQLEAYETSCDPKLGREVVKQQRALKASANTVDRTLADAMEQHYRNANVRVAISAKMINRLVGAERNESRLVGENLAGTYVHGMSDVSAKNLVLLDPSNDGWQMRLNSKGVVESNTLAEGGPARFRSRGMTDFSAQKTVIVTDKGVQLRESKVDASSRNQLVGVTTDYDWMPIFGGYARDRATREYWARQGRVRVEVESRVESQTRETLDEQTRTEIDNIRKQTYDRVTAKLDAHNIKLTPVEMKTTPERLVARLRLASDEQPGSHTPRPRALSDSLASVQIHETALTNLAVTLGLDGKRYTGPELRAKLREKFPQLSDKNPSEIRHDTIFEFAKEDALRVRVNNGKLELAVSFARVELEGDEMRNVTVHAYYLPAIDGLNAELVRDGVLGIEGKFNSGERARLHNVFNRVLPTERHLPIVKVEDFDDKRLKGLMITQLVLEDGWAGIAVGPAGQDRVAERSRSLLK